MPFTIKQTVIFQGDGVGWTESVFFQSETQDLLFAYQNKGREYSRKRSELLGTPCFVKATRMSVEFNDAGQKVLRDSFLKYERFAPLVSAGEPAAEKDAALLVVWQDGPSQKRKNLFLRGIWDSIESDNGVYIKSPKWVAVLDSWRKTILQGRFGWDGDQLFKSAAITNYAVSDASVVTLTLGLATFPDPPVGQPYPLFSVRISKLNNRSVLNGVHTVRPTSATTCVIVTPIACGPFISPGLLTINSKVFVEAATVNDQKIVSRKVGAPLLESRGRARVKPKV